MKTSLSFRSNLPHGLQVLSLQLSRFIFFLMTVQLAKLPRYRCEQHSSPTKIMWLHSISNKTGMNELLIVKSATHKQNHQCKNRRWCLNSSVRSTFTAAVNRGRNSKGEISEKPFSFRGTRASLSNDSPYLGDCVVHNMKCLEGTPEDDKEEKWSQQVLKGNRSEKETKEQL